MLKAQRTADHLTPLFELGDNQTLPGLESEWHDYVRTYHLSEDDIPDLVGIMQSWFEQSECGEWTEEETTVYAPIHAWRALGQLRATAAIEPMVANLDLLDELMDDWSGEDWPHVFGMIGKPAIQPLQVFLLDSSHREFARAQAADSLANIANNHPEFRNTVVGILTEQLARHEQEYTLNGLVLWKLLDMEAVESAEAIERAFAADAIDESVCGYWSEVREKLGVEGLGIAPLRPRKPRPDFNFPFSLPGHPTDYPTDPNRNRVAKKKEKAKRKAAQKSRKRNRKSK